MRSTELGYTLLVVRNTDFEAYTTRRVSIVGMRIALWVWKSLEAHRPDFHIGRSYRSISGVILPLPGGYPIRGAAAHRLVVV